MADALDLYVCPKCKGKLSRQPDALHCSTCSRVYPIADDIPDFLLVRPGESSNRILRNIPRLGRLARLYETKVWYPFVLNVYGGRDSLTFEQMIAYTHEKMNPVKGLVLDVATGPGTHGRRVAGAERTVYGIDFSLDMMRVGQEYVKREGVTHMHFSRADVEYLPFTEHLFDGCFTCGSLHLFPDPVKALIEIARTLKPGAPLVVVTFTPGKSGLPKYEWAQKRLIQRGFHLFRLDEMEVYLSQAGLGQFTPEVRGSILLFTARRKS
jgi:SAM-dependent methyltransferase